jgi:hypothetical protein
MPLAFALCSPGVSAPAMPRRGHRAIWPPTTCGRGPPVSVIPVGRPLHLCHPRRSPGTRCSPARTSLIWPRAARPHSRTVIRHRTCHDVSQSFPPLRLNGCTRTGKSRRCLMHHDRQIAKLPANLSPGGRHESSPALQCWEKRDDDSKQVAAEGQEDPLRGRASWWKSGASAPRKRF